MRAFLGLIILAALTVEITSAITYNVGGSTGGWDSTTNLQAWAMSQTFLVGDNLAFQYAPMHDVVEVIKSDYDSCQTTNVIQSYTGGATIVPLSSPGKKYFICGTPGHCTQGMKLQIDTLAAAATPALLPPPASVLPPISPQQPQNDLFPNSPAPSPAGSFPNSAMSPEEASFPPPTGTLPLSPSGAAGKVIIDVTGFAMVSGLMTLLVVAF
ncbi:uclacyanin 1-like [Impatiens glandulifera]|uniref:uclacyanin 1-like n=1 Tax=Impatiens glandulifera TaxID=253017 RepID=UPI001FB08166|nr:uclacyanin 1-like [Impatiens glandulifera]